MAGNFTFHNKFHRSNHHTLSGLDTIDSGLDPIASEGQPFMGIFYNILTNQQRTFNIRTNSYEWWSNYTTFNKNSATWMDTRSLYTTVSSLSDRWQDGFEAYRQFNSLSARYLALYTTVCSYSADWGSPYLMFTNRTQVYTHSKTFSAQPLRPIASDAASLSTFRWDLDTQQVAFLVVDRNIFIQNPVEQSKINGGLYTLVLTQRNNGVAPNGYLVDFDTQYRFNDRVVRSNIANTRLSGVTVINFVCIQGLMYGDVTYLSGNL
jgi:hypothetical protein